MAKKLGVTGRHRKRKDEELVDEIPKANVLGDLGARVPDDAGPRHGFAILVGRGGAPFAQSERQTRHDTTSGAPAPMGERGAAAADELAKP